MRAIPCVSSETFLCLVAGQVTLIMPGKRWVSILSCGIHQCIWQAVYSVLMNVVVLCRWTQS